jgi:hypothetical protein
LDTATLSGDISNRSAKPTNKRYATSDPEASTSFNVQSAPLGSENQFELLTEESEIRDSDTTNNWASFRPTLTPINQGPRYTGTKPKRPKNQVDEDQWTNLNQWLAENREGRPSFSDVAKKTDHNRTNVSWNCNSTSINNNSANNSSTNNNSTKNNSTNNNSTNNNSTNNNSTNNISTNNNSFNNNSFNNNSSNNNATNKNSTNSHQEGGENNFLFVIVVQLLEKLQLPKGITDFILSFLPGILKFVWDGTKDIFFQFFKNHNGATK